MLWCLHGIGITTHEVQAAHETLGAQVFVIAWVTARWSLSHAQDGSIRHVTAHELLSFTMPVFTVLQALITIFPAIRDRVLLGINALMPALAANLGSSNERIKAVAVQALDALVASTDPSLLVQNFSHIVVNSNVRSKAALVDKLTAIAPQVRAHMCMQSRMMCMLWLLLCISQCFN